ncbi:hypothetical protein ACGFZP_13060 [Kitasatospora sp. NPDC048239]|uniref:hypothetical protein n=1 Tax=Kitasatospora sp. NPDC048239 TaxID=3364046 RepID=UPI0037104B6D
MTKPPITSTTAHTAKFRLVWEDPAGPAQPTNQFAVALGVPNASGRPDSIYLTMGILEPPLLFGSDEEIVERLAESGHKLPVKPLGRFVLTRDRIQELIKILESAAEIYDEAQGEQP